jgi:hypothetical protein
MNFMQEPGRLPNRLVDLPTLLWLVRESAGNPMLVLSVEVINNRTAPATP